MKAVSSLPLTRLLSLKECDLEVLAEISSGCLRPSQPQQLDQNPCAGGISIAMISESVFHPGAADFPEWLT